MNWDKVFHIPWIINLRCKYFISKTHNEIKAFWEDHSNVRKKSPKRHATRIAEKKICGKQPRMLGFDGIEISKLSLKEREGPVAPYTIKDEEMKYTANKEFYHINWNSYFPYFKPIDEIMKRKLCSYINSPINLQSLRSHLINLHSKSLSSSKNFRALFEIPSKPHKRYFLCTFTPSPILAPQTFLPKQIPYITISILKKHLPISSKAISKSLPNYTLASFSEKSLKQYTSMKLYNSLLHSSLSSFLTHSPPAFPDELSLYIHALASQINELVEENKRGIEEICVQEEGDLEGIKREGSFIGEWLEMVGVWKKVRRWVGWGYWWGSWFGEGEGEGVVWERWRGRVHREWYGIKLRERAMICDGWGVGRDEEYEMMKVKELMDVAFGIRNGGERKVERSTVWVVWRREGGMLKMLQGRPKEKKRFVHIFWWVTSGIRFKDVRTFKELEEGKLDEILIQPKPQICEVWKGDLGYMVDFKLESGENPMTAKVHTMWAWLEGYKFTLSRTNNFSKNIVEQKYYECFPLSVTITKEVCDQESKLRSELFFNPNSTCKKNDEDNSKEKDTTMKTE
jgi:hypothetical protein